VSGSFDELAFRADFDDLPVGAERESTELWRATLTGPLEVTVVLAPVTHPTEEFHARLRWQRYPIRPPSILFLDPATGRTDVPRAWPTGGPFRPMSGLCCNYTEEGYASHPEYATDPRLRWTGAGNALLDAIRRLQLDFDVTYAGRHPG